MKRGLHKLFCFMPYLIILFVTCWQETGWYDDHMIGGYAAPESEIYSLEKLTGGKLGVLDKAANI